VPRVVNPISGPMRDPQFMHSVPNGLGVTGVAFCQSSNPHVDAELSLAVGVQKAIGRTRLFGALLSPSNCSASATSGQSQLLGVSCRDNGHLGKGRVLIWPVDWLCLRVRCKARFSPHNTQVCSNRPVTEAGLPAEGTSGCMSALLCPWVVARLSLYTDLCKVLW